MPTERVTWVDRAKGIAIILILASYGAASYALMSEPTGWMGLLARGLEPALIPAIFLVAGLFLSLSLFGSSRTYIDRKLLRLAYFYLVWMVLQTAILDADTLINSPSEFAGQLVSNLVDPPESLSLIYMLAVFHAAMRILRFLPPLKVFGVAAMIQVLFSSGFIVSGWNVTNLFAEWFVFFFAGFAAAPHIFEYAQRMSGQARTLWPVLAGWAMVNAAFVALNIHQLPIIGLVLGFSGAFALVATAVALGSTPVSGPASYLGRQFLPIYLVFTIPMTLLQRGLAATGLVPDGGLAVFLSVMLAMCLALAFHGLAVRTWLNLLFQRPAPFRLTPARAVQSGRLLS
ncbi:acyltransferase family protein [Hyphomonas johnsonii]|uniref:Acyltransferase 3 domain-containing protein n=1 Tax=Hyphomonas johnsonii MHS-2 TaxID=1280950 RepID=A0A059FMA3_9PROT|nr:acyltransferase family protein [Hyphomonas johnsonii]KCZ91784.1 hypothetical protein HJO_11722 [Hyphomonas johnsonii MHS-2]